MPVNFLHPKSASFHFPINSNIAVIIVANKVSIQMCHGNSLYILLLIIFRAIIYFYCSSDWFLSSLAYPVVRRVISFGVYSILYRLAGLSSR